ncbi:BMP family ABC transporter substrate-binding protein [Halorussus salilacus]|uniref:BMP family lipoprotein n=1 Tax=Halorussus salilacus TaxID=2953750 RepID=UPI00209EA55D|nr:BMP family ABC transporter substrate-binding protein [Halorussus salilacus]USZ68778.1 BMP family ABC transporter substrate-binding protein [Halorussus salilacus]
MVKIDPRRRRFLELTGGAGAVGVTGLAGCLGGQDDGSDDEGNQSDGSDDEGTESGSDGGDDSAGDIGMVYATGGLGDNSFNDMAHTGVQGAEDEFGISFRNAEPESQSDVANLQRRFARSSDPDYDLICCIGYVQADALAENAQEFSDQNFTVVDEVVEESNVESYTFREHEGSFQVGHMAGLLTEMDFSAGAGETTDDAVVGFVGGEESPLIEKFEAGYTAGVKHANEDIEVRSAYAGSFNDSAQGQEIALSMFDEGADVIFHAAGGTGNGVFKVAQEEGRFAVGVDADQSESLPEYDDVILASMVKRVDEAVYRSVENVVNGEFEGGQLNELGLEQDGVEVVYGQGLEDDIPEEVTSTLEDSHDAIVDGDIEVPTDPDEV